MGGDSTRRSLGQWGEMKCKNQSLLCVFRMNGCTFFVCPISGSLSHTRTLSHTRIRHGVERVIVGVIVVLADRLPVSAGHDADHHNTAASRVRHAHTHTHTHSYLTV